MSDDSAATGVTHVISKFATEAELWYGSVMLRAFVGIVSHRGIELLCPEDPATVRFLWRRVQREQCRSACFWCVLPHDAVEHIEAALNQGQSQQSLDLLQQLARDYGLLVPHRDDDVLVFAASEQR